MWVCFQLFIPLSGVPILPRDPPLPTPCCGVSFPHSESDVRQLWLQLKKDEPHLLANFEDLLTTIFAQLQEAHEQKTELEYTLRK